MRIAIIVGIVVAAILLVVLLGYLLLSYTPAFTITHVRAQGTDGHINGHLQVWVTEDNITALQMMPDGSTNREYVHNHELRTPVNGTWGESITIEEGQGNIITLQQPLNAEWNTDHLSVVAFVYDDTGVLQATRAQVSRIKN